MNILEFKNFHDSYFKKAFREYFKEIGISLNDDTDVFDLITKSQEEEGMRCLGMCANEDVVGFIMFQVEHMKSNFFKEDLGFIREFWVKKEYRLKGIGTKLFQEVVKEFESLEVKKLILTYEKSALGFYNKLGFKLDLSYTALNEENCIIKKIE